MLRESYINFEKEPEEKKNIIRAVMPEVMEYESMYQPRKRKIKTRRTDTTFQTLHNFRYKCATRDPLERCSTKFMVEMLLELEEEFSEYLASRYSRWMRKFFSLIFSQKGKR